MRPDNEKSIAFTPKSMDSLVYLQTSLSALRSYNRHEASSEPVLKKNIEKLKNNVTFLSRNFTIQKRKALK